MDTRAAKRRRRARSGATGRAAVQAQIDTLIARVEALRGETQYLVGQVERLAKVVASDDDDVQPPPLPERDSRGNRPASETMQALFAAELIARRKRAGMTQEGLARRAGVRAETITRLESGKHAPNVRTVDKIDVALKAAGV